MFNFLNNDDTLEIINNFRTPTYVYSEDKLMESVNNFLNFPSAYGHTVRYAMKANSNKNILKLFYQNGIKIEASSEYEVYRVIDAGVRGDDIHLSGQELSENFEDLLNTGVYFIATSLRQIEEYGKIRRGGELGVRINPGVGSGAFKAISTGGTTSAFGVWYEYIDEIKKIASKYDLKITKIHLHIGSENTPESWVNTADIGLGFIERFPDVTTLDMGGGFKMAIMQYEQSADLQAIGNAVKKKVEDFYKETGRKIHIELEPGKYMVINTCSVVCRVVDMLDTGKDGYKFLRVNTGMTEMPRVPMYGVQQPINKVEMRSEKGEMSKKEKYIIVGHCCESGDVLTTKLYDQEVLEEIELPEVEIGDYLVIDGTGAYNASMSMKNYNSYPEVGELLLKSNGDIVEIRKRALVSECWRNELDVF